MNEELKTAFEIAKGRADELAAVLFEIGRHLDNLPESTDRYVMRALCAGVDEHADDIITAVCTLGEALGIEDEEAEA